ncbi:putative RNA methyltransferase [Ureibacillus acetophenoni]|uniref:23S rRNA m(1)G-748 methyltransferase n=1 Tax=Ureibacillus acetophenoni TaxID=614649 RepID=A0A285UJC1_9BACL|nr:methyltransferase domain-containing protein [Ureibacillus acetophenoni]SOC41949.1 23S rRNA m(1)G-748 methyltransferase [Ureibacillus acetophenoni]
MGKLSKKEASIASMKKQEKYFQCPICKSGMMIMDNGRIHCSQNHSFDIAKQGYVNFLTKHVQSMYSKELFESRREIIQSGLYNRVHEMIAERLSSNINNILDAGCGEGSHLVKICEKIEHDIVSVGIDISKEGIITAAKYYDQNIWCVGDLANSPFQEQTFDCILNFLSPANYEEFKRLLTPRGKVIKLVPQAGYLQQLRKQAYASTEKEQYSNEKTVKLFNEQFSKVDISRITYTQPLEETLVPKLLEMTPLGWHVENLDMTKVQEITIDLDVLIGEI